MDLAEYQLLASRTINDSLSQKEKESHALHGLVGEIGEIHSIYQKVYQGHPVNDFHLKKELGDLMWFVAELCTAKDWELTEVCELNIEKLMARYPDGFASAKSLHREAWDI